MTENNAEKLPIVPMEQFLISKFVEQKNDSTSVTNDSIALLDKIRSKLSRLVMFSGQHDSMVGLVLKVKEKSQHKEHSQKLKLTSTSEMREQLKEYYKDVLVTLFKGSGLKNDKLKTMMQGLQNHVMVNYGMAKLRSASTNGDVIARICQCIMYAVTHEKVTMGRNRVKPAESSPSSTPANTSSHASSSSKVEPTSGKKRKRDDKEMTPSAKKSKGLTKKVLQELLTELQNKNDLYEDFVNVCEYSQDSNRLVPLTEIPTLKVKLKRVDQRIADLKKQE